MSQIPSYFSLLLSIQPAFDSAISAQVEYHGFFYVGVGPDPDCPFASELSLRVSSSSEVGNSPAGKYIWMMKVVCYFGLKLFFMQADFSGEEMHLYVSVDHQCLRFYESFLPFPTGRFLQLVRDRPILRVKWVQVLYAGKGT